MKIVNKLRSKAESLTGDNKSMLTLAGGSVIAQGLGLLFSPILTRLFSPEVFGDVSVFSSITSMAGIIICLRYEQAIVLPEEDDEGFALLKLCLIFTTIISTLVGIVFAFWANTIFTRFNAEHLAVYWYYIPLTLMLGGCIKASTLWFTRIRQFKIISLNKFIPIIAQNIIAISFGLMGYKNTHLRLFSILVSNIVNLLIISGAFIPEFKTKRKSFSYKILINRYKNFLLFDTWGALLNNLSWIIVPILMNSFYSSNAAGQYSISLRVIEVPMSIIGTSINQVFLKTASEKRHEKSLYPYTKSIAKKLLKYTIPVALIIAIFGEQIFSFTFGGKWNLAGKYAQILAPWALIWYVASPLTSIFTICQKQKYSLVISSISLVLRFLSLYVGKYFSSDIIGLILFSCSGVGINLLSLYYSLKIAKANDNS